LFIVLSLCLLFSFSSKPISAQSAGLKALSLMMRQLDIPVILVDSNVRLHENVAIDKDARVSRQELLSIFIDELRASDAVLVKSGSTMQIVPNSRDLMTS
jgi:hypothetical protein